MGFLTRYQVGAWAECHNDMLERNGTALRQEVRRDIARALSLQIHDFKVTEEKRENVTVFRTEVYVFTPEELNEVVERRAIHLINAREAQRKGNGRKEI